VRYLTVRSLRPLAQFIPAEYEYDMCKTSGYPTAAGYWPKASAANIGDRLRGRLLRVRVLRRAHAVTVLKSHDSSQAPGIRLSAQFGNQIIVRGLAEVWGATKSMSSSATGSLAPCFAG
jgi:hypothetical protein